MEKIFLSTLCIWAVFGTISSQQQGRKKDPVPEITQKCLDCICQAQTRGCEELRPCTNSTPSCGPFAISFGYWTDGGSPSNETGTKITESHDEFVKCVMDKECSEVAIKGYMNKYRYPDCDKDELFTCDDVALIHLLGSEGCAKEPIPQPFWTNYIDCFPGNNQN